MAKEIEWTETSVRDRLKIYQFWWAHNQSETYSIKLELLFNKSAQLIAQFPEAGTISDYPEIRVIVVRDFKIFYKVFDTKIVSLGVWDARQNPEIMELA